MNIKIEEHLVDKRTDFGVVKRSLNQFRVMLTAQADEPPRLAGYIGNQADAKFLPLAGFPSELAPAVCVGLSKLLNRSVSSVAAPPILEETSEPMELEIDEEEGV